jgi:hypothetical protein
VGVGHGKGRDVTEQGNQNSARIQFWDYANQQWRLNR